MKNYIYTPHIQRLLYVSNTISFAHKEIYEVDKIKKLQSVTLPCFNKRAGKCENYVTFTIKSKIDSVLCNDCLLKKTSGKTVYSSALISYQMQCFDEYIKKMLNFSLR